jgi:hypothetical protein
MDRPVLVRRRLVPSAIDARLLLDAVSEVEPVDEAALPPAYLAARALAAVREDAPTLVAERVLVSVTGVAHADTPTRLAGAAYPLASGRAGARVRAVQPAGRVLALAVEGRLEPVRETLPRPIPGHLAAYVRALELDPRLTSRAVSWPADFVVALCAAGVEAENEGPLSRLVRLSVELVHEAPIERVLHLANLGVHPVSGDMARVVFRVTGGNGRLVARGDALIVSALARSCALAMPIQLAA